MTTQITKPIIHPSVRELAYACLSTIDIETSPMTKEAVFSLLNAKTKEVLKTVTVENFDEDSNNTRANCLILDMIVECFEKSETVQNFAHGVWLSKEDEAEQNIVWYEDMAKAVDVFKTYLINHPDTAKMATTPF